MRLEIKSHSVRVGWRRRPIITDLNLIFDDDRCHCLVGINGVGKTALLLSLTRRNGLRRPDGEWQPAMYASPRELIAAETMSVEGFVALLPRRPPLDEWALADVGRQTIDSLSQGEKTRLMLCIADSISPQCLLLDEPTLGLDHESQKMLGAFIARRLANRRTTIVSTHDLSALDTEDCRIVYMHPSGETTKVVEADELVLKGTAQVAFADRAPVALQGSAAAIARALLEMQVKRFR